MNVLMHVERLLILVQWYRLQNKCQMQRIINCSLTLLYLCTILFSEVIMVSIYVVVSFISVIGDGKAIDRVVKSIQMQIQVQQINKTHWLYKAFTSAVLE